MFKQSFINKILQNTRKPEGFWGRIILRGMNKGHAPLSKWGMSYLKWSPEWSLLDVGCGGGANLAEMSIRCPEGSVYGIDISEESVKFARKKNRDLLGKRCFIEQGSVEKLPYENEMFNVVTAFETIYFWSDLLQSFTEIARVLKKDGIFLICCEMSDPSNTMWTSRIDGMTIYPVRELRSLLSRSGFTDISVYKRRKEDWCIIAQK